jgi:serine phosphatase RsbU (regulator of sigma subunit)
MARAPRRSPRGRRRAEPEVEPIEVEPLEELEPLPSRGGRGGGRRGGGGRPAAGGMGIGGKILLITIPPIALIALLCGLMILSGLPKPVEADDSVDAGGIATVRTLAAVCPDGWSPKVFTTSEFRARVRKIKEDELEELHPKRAFERNARVQKEKLEVFDREILDKYVPEEEHPLFEPGKALPEEDWLATWESRIESVQLGEGFLGVRIHASTSRGVFSKTIWAGGTPRDIDTPGESRVVGGTQVQKGTVQGVPVRRYTQNVLDLGGMKVGTVRLWLAEPPAAKPSGNAKIFTILMMVLVIGAAVVVSVILTTLISNPLRALVRDIDAVARGDTNRSFHVREGGEIGLIGRHLEKMTRNLEAMKHAEVEQQTAEAHFSIATQIQENLLPASPPRIEGYEIEAMHKPSPDLGSDYHDFLDLGNGKLGIVVADASMKGTTGAMIMSQVRSLVRAFAPDLDSPAEVLRGVNQVFAKDLKKGLYVTAVYMILDLESGIITVANAGHPATLFWKLSKRAVARLPTDGLALGLDEGPVFDEKISDKRVQLEAGDRVVLYTDGAVEAQNPSDLEFGEENFVDLVKRESPKNSAAFVNLVANEIDLFHEGAVQKDDITILTVRKVR